MIRVPIYFITNRKLTDSEQYFNVLSEINNYKNIKVILREKDLSSDEYLKLYYKVKEIAPNNEIIINSKLDVFKLVREKTVQLPYKDFMELQDFKYNVGVSVHSVEEGIVAYKKGAKYLLASHIFETSCKDGIKPKDIDFIKELRNKVKCEIIALGGIDTNNYKSVINSGADGIAMMSMFYKFKDLNSVINRFQY